VINLCRYHSQCSNIVDILMVNPTATFRTSPGLCQPSCNYALYVQYRNVSYDNIHNSNDNRAHRRSDSIGFPQTVRYLSLDLTAKRTCQFHPKCVLHHLDPFVESVVRTANIVRTNRYIHESFDGCGWLRSVLFLGTGCLFLRRDWRNISVSLCSCWWFVDWRAFDTGNLNVLSLLWSGGWLQWR